ncbi:MAG TPA: hypothetical protein VEW04_04950 [Allosphingosinicella sp.]|nr:hypothetical protein [Allosphingosinicella sp.]
MRMDTLRMTVGFLIIASHLASFGMVLLGGTLVASERTELSLIIAPLFAVYVTAIVRRMLAMETFDKTPTHPAVAILGVGIAVIFALAIPLIIWSFEAGRIENFDALKSTIGIVETSLGLYTGALVDRLFGGPATTAQGAPQLTP